MVWLASFPRSGNTFFRNILFEVYGLESSTFHLDHDYFLDENYLEFPFIKTHLLPRQLNPPDAQIPAVYIIRDGRDALVSIAHHRKDIIAPGSDFYTNLKEAIIAEKGSFFGGWSKNVTEWVQRAGVVIRYEDLLVDPIKEAERIRKIYDLPEPNIKKIPKFENLKFGIPHYGSGKDRGYSEDKMHDLAMKNFRKGKAGSWKEEMPEELLELFWSYHGETMEKMGYTYEGNIARLHHDLDNELRDKLGLPEPEIPTRKYKVLIESNKIVSNDNDGVKRYQVEILKGLLPTINNPFTKWDIDLFVHGEIIPLKDFDHEIKKGFDGKDLKQESNLKQRGKKSLFERVELLLIGMVPRSFVNYLQKKNITILHRIYDLMKNMMINIVGFFVRFKKAFDLRAMNSNSAYLKLSPNSELDNVLNSYDLIHLPLPHHYQPFLHARTKFITTVHDLTHIYYPEHHTKINIANSYFGIKFIFRKGSDVIAVSNSTRRDLIKATDIHQDKVKMIYEAADKDKFSLQTNGEDNRLVKEKYGILTNDPYIICLSTIEPRKNLKNTIKGFIQLIKENPDIKLNLVIAGKKGWETTKLFLKETLFLNRVIFTGFVDDADIASLYSEAMVMSYLSFYEGFGLPPLEAMNCGIPVIYGNNSSLIEVVDQGGVPVNPHDIDEIKNAFAKMYFDEEFRKEKSRAALKQSLKFSWRKTIIETLNAYEDVISDKRGLNN